MKSPPGSVDEVCVIIPVFNETKIIRSVLNKVLEKIPNVVCVNDGSIDNSAEEIAKTSAVLVNHPINLGQGAALQTGIEYSLLDPKAKYFVTFDADGQHQLEDVERMLKVLLEENLDIVLGSRFLGKAHNISSLKKMTLKLAVKFTNKTSGLKLTDAHNGLRVFNRRVAEELNIVNSDFSHASEIIETIANKEFKYKEVPVTIVYSEYSKAKGQSMLNAVNMGLDILFDRLIK
jgi:glycosyltransferase involved in cell wall biosynthesis